MYNKFILGTVQFGLEYGVANSKGKVKKNEVAKILSIAQSKGIKTLDTAINYGDSETILGEIGVDGWEVISKLPSVPEKCKEISSWVRMEVEGSLMRLGLNKINSLLLHDSAQIFSKQGDEIYRSIEDLKSEKILNSTGISIYNPGDITRYLHNKPFDIVQLPFNVVDQRLLKINFLDNKKFINCEVHVRSIFLQGLLLMPKEKRPSYFEKWKQIFNSWDYWIKSNDINAVEVCVNHALSNDSVDKVLIGIDSRAQLEEILSAVGADIPSIPDDLKSEDVLLLNPSNWKV
jgi:aryl-alcohol dehydrogenase-like predicted oxidoreductase